MKNIKIVDTNEYLTTLRELVQEGKIVSLLITGNSMSPFLVNQRDYVYFKQPDRPLRRGDIVFYQRDDGHFVMHRIYQVREENGIRIYDIVGDNQSEIEEGIREDQIFGIITQVKRNGKMIQPGDFWWGFFAKIWPVVLPFRKSIVNIYSGLRKR